MNNINKFWRALVCAIALTPFAAGAQLSPREGADYIALSPPQPVRVSEDKIEVLEFFNFSCPHCFRLQGIMARWKRDNDLSDVTLLHQPVIFRSYAGHYARVFYTLEGLDRVDELYGGVFRAIHRDKKLLNSQSRFVDWLEENGADEDQADKIYESFSVGTKVARAQRITEAYGVNSTPQIAIAGKYLLTPSVSGSLERMMDIAAALVKRERKERGL